MLDRVPSPEDPGVPGSSLPPIPQAPSWLRIRDLGRVPYGAALELQRTLQASVREARERGEVQGHLLLLEHDPGPGTSILLAELPGFAGADFAALPGGDSFVYPRLGDAAGDLVLVREVP